MAAAKGDSTGCDCINLKNAVIPGAESKVLEIMRALLSTGSQRGASKLYALTALISHEDRLPLKRFQDWGWMQYYYPK